MAYFRNAMPNG